MNEDPIKFLWNEGKRNEPKVELHDIDGILECSARHGWSGLRVNVLVIAGMLVIALMLSVLNVIEYAGEPAPRALHAGLILVTLVLLVLSRHVWRKLRDVDDPGVSLTVLVRKQMSFFHTTFEWWLCLAAVTTWIFSFVISVWVANQHGRYRIGPLIEYSAVSAAVVFASYVLLRLGHLPMVQRTLAALQDLEAQACEHTRKVQAQRKYWIIATAVMVVVLTIAVGLTIMAWLQAGP